ncbi:MAG TPA: host-nuclease inhibitor Gam family protein [Bacteroidales bacterium]|nr:host-nuclease inhibitor Gam family protein [Bacteroidales bacterium]
MESLGSAVLDRLLAIGTDEDTVPEGKESFVIDNDSKAEWALEKIKAERADMERLVSLCEQKIAEYQEKIELFKKQYENSTSFLVSCLQQYFNTVPHKKTKIQETYKLPSGTLKLKYPGPEFVRDEETLVKWLKDNNYTDHIKIKESADWASLKAKVKVDKGNVITEDGEIIEGVKAVDRPPEFKVEV